MEKNFFDFFICALVHEIADYLKFIVLISALGVHGVHLQGVLEYYDRGF